MRNIRYVYFYTNIFKHIKITSYNFTVSQTDWEPLT